MEHHYKLNVEIQWWTHIQKCIKSVCQLEGTERIQSSAKVPASNCQSIKCNELTSTHDTKTAESRSDTNNHNIQSTVPCTKTHLSTFQGSPSTNKEITTIGYVLHISRSNLEVTLQPNWKSTKSVSHYTNNSRKSFICTRITRQCMWISNNNDSQEWTLWLRFVHNSQCVKCTQNKYALRVTRNVDQKIHWL